MIPEEPRALRESADTQQLTDPLVAPERVPSRRAAGAESPAGADTMLFGGVPTPPQRVRTLERRFEFGEHLGTGGMSTVRSAWDKVLEQEVALKSIRPDAHAGDDEFERLRNEVKLARRIQHVNVAQVYDLIEVDGAVYLCMELVKGITLESFIAERGPVPLHVARGIIRQLAKGLQAAHDQGVIHRDLKPANIIVSEDGSRACILDFGIARDLGADADGAELIIGSPRYMSPEQVAGIDVDTRSDVHGLGLLMYEMLAGQPAFPLPVSPCRRTLVEQRRRPPSVAARVPDLPDYVSEAIDRCLSFDRDERFETPTEFLNFIFQRRSAESVVPSPAAPGRPRVLVATSRPRVGPVVAEHLSSLGCEALAVQDGVHALSELIEKTHQLIILDPELPRVDGLLVHEVVEGGVRGEAPWTVFLVTEETQRAEQARLRNAFDVLDASELGRLSETAKILLDV